MTGYSQYTLARRRIGWTSFVICRPGAGWRWGGPSFWRLTRRGAERAAKRKIDGLNARSGFTTRYER